MSVFYMTKGALESAGSKLTAEGSLAVSHLLKVFSEEPHGNETLILKTTGGQEICLFFTETTLTVMTPE